MTSMKNITVVKASISDIEKSQNIVYNGMFSRNGAVRRWAEAGMLFKSWSDKYTKPSDNSFCLEPRGNNTEDEAKGNVLRTLIDRFGISDLALFEKKFDEAVSGDGKEWRRISTLHSSSLLALLCFYSVTAEHPLSFQGYTFTDSYFEVKTSVRDSHNSNMDTVLRGTEDATGKKVVLFLESKFSEYLESGMYNGISSGVYHDTYESFSLFTDPISPLCFVDDGSCITISSKKNGYYCGGIKQMISHFIGVSHYVDKGECALGAHSRFKYENDEVVMLGEILFRLPKETDRIDRFGKYCDTYKELAKRMNGISQFKIFDKTITYQDVFAGKDFIKEDVIREFYGF